MPYLEFPKALYRDGDVANECVVVQNADEEAQAGDKGFLALPANPPPEPAQPGGPAHLPYPKMLYLGGELGADTRVVANAEREAEEAAHGYLPLNLQPAADADAPSKEPAATPAPKKPGRKPKAAATA